MNTTTTAELADRAQELLGYPFGPEKPTINLFAEPQNGLAPERIREFEGHIEELLRIERDHRIKVRDLCDTLKDSLTPEERSYLGKRLVEEVTARSLQILETIPSLAELEEQSFSTEILGLLVDRTQYIQELIDTANIVAQIVGRGGGLSQMIQNLSHDNGGRIRAIAGFANLILEHRKKNGDGQECKEAIRTYLDSNIASSRALLEANHAAVSGRFPFKNFCLRDALMEVAKSIPAIASVNLGQEPASKPQSRTITIAVDEEISLRGHESGLRIVVLNLLKNARRPQNNPSESMAISAREISHDCVEISVRDFGNGFSRANILAIVRERAKEKLSTGKELSPVEKAALDTRASQYISDARLFGYYFERGISFSNGGHGLGLAIVKTIINGHQGDIMICNHPDGGAEIKIILPNTEEDDPVKRQQTTMLALMAELQKAI